MARWPLIVACVAGVALLAPACLAAQGPGPKTGFTDALARFSLALDGAYGDEGPAAAESLSQMERVRQRWDALIRTYETGMAAEVGERTAGPRRAHAPGARRRISRAPPVPRRPA